MVIRTLCEDVKRMSKGDAILSCIILCRNVPVHAALLGAVAVSGNAKVVVRGVDPVRHHVKSNGNVVFYNSVGP